MLGCATMYIYSSSSTHFLRFTLSPLILSMILSMKSWGHLADILGTSGNIWDHFGTTLESLWDHYGAILGAPCDHSKITLGLLLDYSEITPEHSGTTMGPFWDHSGVTIGHSGNTLGSLWDHSGRKAYIQSFSGNFY